MATPINPNALQAVYTEPLIDDFRGNPLIEALPGLAPDKDVLRRLINIPKVSHKETLLPSHIRGPLTSRIRKTVVPLPEYLRVYRKMEDALLRAYSTKNPLSPTTNHYLHYLSPTDTQAQPITGQFQPEGSAISVVGTSGVGKSHMIKTILGSFPQLIQHTRYKGRDLDLLQLVWIYVECPPDGTLASFCKWVLFEIDKVIGTDEYMNAVRKRYSTSDLLLTIERCVRNLFVGLIVFDEASNLEPPKNGHAHPLLTFLLTLINRSGVPFVFIGNPDMEDVFSSTLRIARRAENGGYVRMRPLAPAVWDQYMKVIWTMQLTNPTTPFDPELSEHLRDITGSIPALAALTFHETQLSIIGSGNERITKSALNEGHRRAVNLSRRPMKWEDNRTGKRDVYNKAECAEHFEPIADGANPEKKAKQAPEKGISDPCRVQHPEFEDRLAAAMNSAKLPISDLKPSLLRDAAEAIDVMEYLRGTGIILEDPLRDLGSHL